MSLPLCPTVSVPEDPATTAIMLVFICCLRIDLFMAYMACDLSDFFFLDNDFLFKKKERAVG